MNLFSSCIPFCCWLFSYRAILAFMGNSHWQKHFCSMWRPSPSNLMCPPIVWWYLHKILMSWRALPRVSFQLKLLLCYMGWWGHEINLNLRYYCSTWHGEEMLTVTLCNLETDLKGLLNFLPSLNASQSNYSYNTLNWSMYYFVHFYDVSPKIRPQSTL